MPWNVDTRHGDIDDYESPKFFPKGMLPLKPKVKELCITCTNFECEITDRNTVLGCDEWEGKS